MATMDELVAAIGDRYARSGRVDKGRILDEFVAVAGIHRKHAQRLLKTAKPSRRSDPRPGRRIYDDAVRETLVLLWEASDRICGKRLKCLLPALVESMERHGHICLADGVRAAILSMSAARHRSVLAGSKRAIRRPQAPPGGRVGGAAQKRAGSDLLRLERSAAGLLRSRSRRP